MKDARHLVVEEPDGSVAIAFNEDVPPPEIPPEPPRTRVIHRVIGVKYDRTAKLMSYALSFSSLFCLMYLDRIVDAINTLLICATTVSIHTENRPYSVIVPTTHGTISLLMIVPFAVLHMWDQVAYQVGCVVLCAFSIRTAEDVTVEHLEEIP